MEFIKNTFNQAKAKLWQLMGSYRAEQLIFRAALQSSALFLGSILLLYTLGILAFVTLKWESPTSRQYKLPPHTIPLDQSSLQRLLTDPDATAQQLDQRIKGLQALVHGHHDIYYETQVHLEELHQSVEDIFAEPLQIPKLMRRHAASTTPSLLQRTPHVTAFLQALSDQLQDTFPTPTLLKEGLHLASRELLDLVRDETTPWDQVTAWLQSPYWRSIRWDNFDGNRYCPSLSLTNSAAANNTSMSPNDQEFIHELVQWVRQLLEQRDKDEVENCWQATLDETNNVLEKFYQDKVAIALNQLKYLGSKYKRTLKKMSSSAAVETHGSMDDCPVTKDKVLSMMEAGLDALYRKKDIRQAVGVTASNGVQDESYIIVDAVLDEPWKPPRAPYPESINLRHMIDKPILKLLAKWIDDGLDLVGGHSDFFDSRVDALTQGGDDLGTAAVEYLLRQAGKIQVPVPLKIQTKRMAQVA